MEQNNILDNKKMETLLEEYEKKKKDNERNIEEIKTIREQIEKLTKEIENLEKIKKEDATPIETKKQTEEKRIEKVIEETVKKIDENNEKIIKEKIIELQPKYIQKTKNSSIKEKINKISNKIPKPLKRWYSKYVALPIGILSIVALSYNTPQEYYDMYQNWHERHIEKSNIDDPNIIGIDNKFIDTERSTYDFLGKDKINYKSGYYISSVFDLSDRTPPRFKVINDRENYNKIDSAAGITTSLFEKFQKFNNFEPKLKGHLDKDREAKGDIPIIGYNPSTQKIKAGHYKEFDENWLVSETYEIPLNFKLNKDSTINLTYPPSTLRMCPVTINENGKEIPFPIGITKDKSKKTFKPHEANHFGVLEGGKVIITCGDKQLQVNGSFADMFCVYERLQKEYKGLPIQAYLLDNGSYNLPIWNKDNVLTTKEIKEHLMRHRGGGTALVLINDGKISPYEYKNKYKEFEHYTPNYTLDSLTGKPAKNEKYVIVLHHTGNYADPNIIIKQFEDTTSETSSHVLILKDGTRHLFNTDDYVLAHAGKSNFNDKDKVNYFSLGIELEGDSKDGQFTLAQLESMLEYIRPRVEKYNISFNNITTHKIIRDNYIKKYPNEKNIPTKRDLDEKVWKQIRELINKKLYKNKGLVLNDTSKKLLQILAYQEIYRKTEDKDYSSIQAKEVLKYYNKTNKQNIKTT